MGRGNRFEGILAALLLVGLTTAAVVASAGAQGDAVAFSIRSAVSVIDAKTNRVVVRAVKVGPFPSAIAFTPDGSRVYVVKN
ncbi:MAG: hypothetical protein JJE35_12235 [Thermoleophilia bacterium]|nr:hypothetical protein [Thermoleophilia bacterium]